MRLAPLRCKFVSLWRQQLFFFVRNTFVRFVFLRMHHSVIRFVFLWMQSCLQHCLIRLVFYECNTVKSHLFSMDTTLFNQICFPLNAPLCNQICFPMDATLFNEFCFFKDATLFDQACFPMDATLFNQICLPLTFSVHLKSTGGLFSYGCDTVQSDLPPFKHLYTWNLQPVVSFYHSYISPFLNIFSLFWHCHPHYESCITSFINFNQEQKSPF